MATIAFFHDGRDLSEDNNALPIVETGNRLAVRIEHGWTRSRERQPDVGGDLVEDLHPALP